MKLFSKITLLIVSVLSLTFLAISCSTDDVNEGASTELSSFSIPAKKFANESFEITPPTSNRTGNFTYTSSNPAVATVSGTTITMVGIGVTEITATQASFGKFATASIKAFFKVTEFDPPTLGIFTVPSKLIGDPAFDLTAPTSNSTGEFAFTSSNPLVATVSGKTVTIVGVGITTITATQEAKAPFDSNFATAQLVVKDRPELLLEEYFEYNPSTILSDIPGSGWVIHSGSSFAIQTTKTANLAFSKYYGEGKGLAVVLDANGADSNKKFDEQPEGTTHYVSFVVKVKAPTSTGTIPPASYFFHTSAATFVSGSSASFRGNIFSVPIANDVNQYNLGLSFSGTSPTQTNTAKKLNYEQNYLVVLKYSSIAGANNDSVSLYVFDENENFQAEPSETFLGPITGSLPDVQPAAVCLRQFAGDQDMLIDAIRVATRWNLNDE